MSENMTMKGVDIKSLNPGDKVKVKNIMYIDKTIMSWKNGDVLTIREVEPLYDRILVNDTDSNMAEYIYDYEFDGLTLEMIE